VSAQADAHALSILVEDTGSGIPAELQPRIFDPFFTTRTVGQGKGLGLTVCRDVAIAHGGKVEFSSTPGVGSRFALILPFNPDPPE
jgi:two-component system, NtrC family, sensor kinase